MNLEQIRESSCVTAKLKAGERAEVWHDKRLKVGDIVMVSQLYTHGQGYEATVVRVSNEGTTLGGTHLWRYEVEPTGRVEEIVAYCNH